MAVAPVNTLLQDAAAKLTIPYSPHKIPVVDRHHYSTSGSDYGGYSHGSSHKKSSHSIALSALTLLAFLFFLNILQNCLQEHMDSMTPQVVVVTRIKAAREAEKRKGEDGIFINTTVVNETDVENDAESRLEEIDDEEANEKDKYFVKLVSRYHEETKPID